MNARHVPLCVLLAVASWPKRRIILANRPCSANRRPGAGLANAGRRERRYRTRQAAPIRVSLRQGRRKPAMDEVYLDYNASTPVAPQKCAMLSAEVLPLSTTMNVRQRDLPVSERQAS